MKLHEFNEKTQAKLRQQMRDDDARMRLARLFNPQPEQNPSSPDAGEVRGQAGRKTGVGRRLARKPRILVTITSHRRRLLDDDNLSAGAKILRDRIAETFSTDDSATGGICFEYGQCLTKGKCGTVVKIEAL